jgi:hypothetical protein
MLVEAKMCTFTLESKHFIFNKCPIYTSDGASAKFITNKHETDYTVRGLVPLDLLLELFFRHHPRSPPMNRRHHLEITLSSPVVGKHPDLLVGPPTSTVFPTNDRNFERSQFFEKIFEKI